MGTLILGIPHIVPYRDPYRTYEVLRFKKYDLGSRV